MKEHWHRIVHKRTGEVQHVASLVAINLDDYDAVPIKGNRAPGEFEDVKENGAIVRRARPSDAPAVPAVTVESLAAELAELREKIAKLETPPTRK